MMIILPVCGGKPAPGQLPQTLCHPGRSEAGAPASASAPTLAASVAPVPAKCDANPLYELSSRAKPRDLRFLRRRDEPLVRSPATDLGGIWLLPSGKRATSQR